jgi:UDP-glucose 4-epimerase
MKVLVTGGAGYVGSHAVRALLRAGHDVVVLDNLTKGHRDAVTVRLIEADVADAPVVRGVLRDEAVEAVMHFAAFAAAGESVRNPGLYFGNNVCGTVALLDAMAEVGVSMLVFSSSCSVYGQPEVLPVAEAAPTAPESPYGLSKLMCEHVLPWYARAHGLRYASLRYFNAAGAATDGSLGDDVRPATRILPVLLEVVLGKRSVFALRGDDYPTADGTCIRDYVHVDDLADAHVRALGQLAAREPGGDVYNLGSGHGYSNRDVIAMVEQVTGRSIPVVVEARRPGDPAAVYADNRKAAEELGWRPRNSALHTLVATAWDWRRRHPDGYRA